MNVRLEHLADKKKAIFESALNIIKDHGFHGCPMSLISKNANVACGTIYHYFDSKDTLIKELYQYLKQQMLDAMLADVLNTDDVKKTFFSYWMNLCQYFISHSGTMRFMEQYINSPYYHIEPPENKTVHTVMYQVLEKGMQQGVIKKLSRELLIPVIHGSIVATAKSQITGRYDYQHEELQHVVQIIWDGIALKS